MAKIYLTKELSCSVFRLFSQQLNIVSCALVGGYCVSVAVAILLRSSLRLVVTNSIHHAFVPGYVTFVSVAPFQVNGELWRWRLTSRNKDTCLALTRSVWVVTLKSTSKNVTIWYLHCCTHFTLPGQWWVVMLKRSSKNVTVWYPLCCTCLALTRS